MAEENLWLEIGNRCLKQALSILESETALTMEAVGAIRALVATAIEIEELNLRYEEQSRFYASGSQGHTLLQHKARN